MALTTEVARPDLLTIAGGWSNNWLWSLPLIVLTVLAHGFGLIEIREHVVVRLTSLLGVGRSRGLLALVVASTVLLLTGLHALEGGAWAFAYIVLGASSDPRLAMLYSLSAMTSYGHANIYLEPEWQMMGALEALNGMMLFGLTTAFLFSVPAGPCPLTRGEEPQTLEVMTYGGIGDGRASRLAPPWLGAGTRPSPCWS